MPLLTPAPQSAPRPSSAATQPAIPSPPPAPGQSNPGAERRPEFKMSVNDDRPQPSPGVLSIEAYVPGKSTAPGAARVFKLSANETPLGPSPRAIDAFRSAAEHLHDYPEGTARKLREAIGKSFGLDPARIVCGAGSDDLLNMLTQSYVGPGDEAIYTRHGFRIYPIFTLAAGGTPVM